MGVTIVDYGAGNLRSVARAVERVGWQACVTSDPDAVRGARALILPGVGAAADTMRNLRERGLLEPVREYIDSGRPFLGICMGLQALLIVSEEGGEHECLGVIAGRVRRLPPGLKVPHMGWNQVRQRRSHPLFEGIPDNAYFYFVHSYYPEPEDPSVVIGDRLRGYLRVGGGAGQPGGHPVPSGEERRGGPAAVPELPGRVLPLTCP